MYLRPIYLLLIHLTNAFYHDGIDSFMQYSGHEDFREVLSFEFKTNESSGLLLYIDNGRRNDNFQQFSLHNGTLYLTMEGVQMTINKQVDDGMWHSIRFYNNVNQAFVKLQLDQQFMESISVNFSNSDTFIDGLPQHLPAESLSNPSSKKLKNFVGSIRNLFYNSTQSPRMLESKGVNTDDHLCNPVLQCKNVSECEPLIVVCHDNSFCYSTDDKASCICNDGKRNDQIALDVKGVQNVTVDTCDLGCTCDTVKFSPTVLSGYIGTNHRSGCNLECKWIVEPSDPWLSLRLNFDHINTNDDDDVIEIYQVENDQLVLLESISRHWTWNDFLLPPGSGLQISFKSPLTVEGKGFSANFSRFASVSWSGLEPAHLKEQCINDNDEISLYLYDSCYTLGVSPLEFDRAFQACGRFPNGHLAFINQREIMTTIIDTFKENITTNFLSIGLRQIDKTIPENKKTGWVWKLPKGHSWKANYNDTSWYWMQPDNGLKTYSYYPRYPTDDGNPPYPWEGKEDFGAIAYHDHFKTRYGIFDTNNEIPLQYICQYNARWSCPSVLYKVEWWANTISSPNEGGNVQCYYMLIADEYASVNLTLTENKLGPYDVLKIYDGNTKTENLLGIWTSSSSIKSTKASRTNKLLVVFKSSVQGSTFKATYERQSSQCKCKNETIKLNIKSNTETLTSPGYPNNYCDNLDCAWNFESHNEYYTVQFEIKDLDLEGPDDYLIIKDTENSNTFDTSVIARYTNSIGQAKYNNATLEDLRIHGEQMFQPQIFTPGHKSQLYFHSDGKKNRKGFTVAYSLIERDTSCYCPQPQPGVYNSLNGVIRFHHTTTFCDGIDCVFYLIAPLNSSNGSRLWMNVSVNAPQPYGSLKVFQGLLYDVNNFDNSPEIFHVSSHKLRLKPKFGGFTIHYHAEAKHVQVYGDNKKYGFYLEYEWVTGCSCPSSKPLQAESQAKMITSPSHSGRYCPKLDCVWKIEAPKDHQVVLHVIQFNTEDDYDLLYIFDGWAPKKTSLLKILTGFQQEQIIESSSEKVQLRFKTDKTTEFDGFVIEYYSKPHDKSLPYHAALKATNTEDDHSSNKNTPDLLAIILIAAIFVLLFINFIFIVYTLVLYRKGKLRFRRKKEQTKEKTKPHGSISTREYAAPANSEVITVL